MTERLLRKARRGDADAFTALCAPFEGMIYRHCLQILRNPADAQDAAQEAMLKAYRAITSFEGRSELATWLFRIAHNVSLDALKKVYRHNENTSLEALQEQGFNPPADSDNPEARYLQESEQAALREAVAALSMRQQTLLSLRYGDGLSYDQIAREMGIKPGTVKSALNRAKESLRAAAAQDMEA